MLSNYVVRNLRKIFHNHNVLSERFRPLSINIVNFYGTSTEPNKPNDLFSFIQHENNYVYKIVNRTPLISSTRETILGQETILQQNEFDNYLNKNWRQSNASDIVKAFEDVEQYCIDNNVSVTDSIFDNLVDGLMDHCEKLTDQEILRLLNCLSKLPPCNAFDSQNYHEVWSCLDDICCWKMVNWDLETLFAIADVWYQLRLAKLGDYIFELLDRLCRRADRISKDDLVRVFFYYNVCRKRPVDFEFEHALQDKLEEMTVDELAVVALGFFKTRSKIKLAPIIETMIREVTNSTLGIHEITLTAIMKALRLTSPFKFLPQIQTMLDRLHPELGRFSDLAGLHVALLATGTLCFHPITLRTISQKLVENISNLRLKDIERTLNVLTMFAFDPKTKPDIFQLAFEELHKTVREEEIHKYPRAFVSALYYLSLKGTFSYELMDKVLSMDFVKENFGKAAKTLPSQLFSLDTCIDIDCPDYKGRRIDRIHKYKAVKWLTEWAPSYDQHKKISRKDQFFLDAIDATKKIVKHNDYVMVDHVLPHFPTADIIICKDKVTGTYIKPSGLEDYALGDVKRPANDESKIWYAIVVLNWNNVVHYTSTPLGLIDMKLRQLKKIGFNPIQILYYEFTHLSQNEKEKYILNKLSNK
ncbi:hypothetical protein ABEB36_007321 [Hypothenemus hampei]|uniref:RAP domain-containing protein n=1 Tax=Hypothenemus hampei TaxID=57062 RepID=A0ABD1ETJ4_HYPHA